MASVTLLLAFLLGLLFLSTGALKLMVPHEQAAARLGWVSDLPPNRYRLAGWLEIAGGVGLMFPTMVQAIDRLTALAAVGLAILMSLAAGLHVRRREWIPAIGTLALAAALVAIAADSA